MATNDALSKKVDKKEMVAYLSSTNKIRETLADSLYDQGLDNWNDLIEGDDAYFMNFKGVGKKTAEVLQEMATQKSESIQASEEVPDIDEILSTVPRITQPVIASLKESGYTDLSKFKDKTSEDLREVKGIGPKLSEAMIKVIEEAIEKYGAEPLIEDATAEAPAEEEEEQEAVEEEKKESIFDRIIGGIKSMFGGKKKAEETTEVEADPEVEDKPDEEAPQEEEGSDDEEVKEEEDPKQDEEKADEEAASEEKKDEEPAADSGEPVDEAPVEEEKADEDVENGDEADESESEPSDDMEEPAEEDKADEEKKPEDEKAEEPAKPGILDRIMGFFKGSKKEVEASPAEEEPVEDKEEAEETASEEEVPADEGPAPQEEAADESEGEKEEDPAEENEVIEAGPRITEIEDVPGIKKGIASKLKEAGYMNVDELKEAVVDDLLMIEGIGEKTAAKVCESVKDL